MRVEEMIKWLMLFCISSPLIWAPISGAHRYSGRCLKASEYTTGGCMIFNFTAKDDFTSPLTHAHNKKLECKDHQIYSEMLRKICKKEA